MNIFLMLVWLQSCQTSLIHCGGRCNDINTKFWGVQILCQPITSREINRLRMSSRPLRNIVNFPGIAEHMASLQSLEIQSLVGRQPSHVWPTAAEAMENFCSCYPSVLFQLQEFSDKYFGRKPKLHFWPTFVKTLGDWILDAPLLPN